MADQDDFSFDEPGSDSEEWVEEEPKKKKKKRGGGGSSRTRLQLLLLLLLVLVGGAYYYFMVMPGADSGPAAPPKVVVKAPPKKKIAMPDAPKKAVPQPVKEAAAPAPVEKPAEQVAAKPAPEPAAAPASAPAPVPAPAKEVAKAEPVATPMPDSPVKQEVFEPAVKTIAPAPATGGAYSLVAGTFLLDSSIKRTSKQVRALGYEPVLTPVKQKVKMTRLALGTFSPAAAAAKKAELKSTVPDIFGIRKGDKVTLYVGSFVNLDSARRYADKLYKQGIILMEEPVQVEQTLQQVSFGSFASKEAAADVKNEAAAKGVKATIVSN
ncbi:MAG: hypothetical protein C0615_06430 [Desulfuromonas sp.]|nr:MAG: hypothetical protein C0615_06430 [Desulfuromonas sp.]